MFKTYITTMQDKSGAFLRASKIIAHNSGNIVRVSYNKAVDIHTLFIDVEADEARLDAITAQLEHFGYLTHDEQQMTVLLVEFKLPDRPGAVTPVLEILSRHKINISYMSSQANGSAYQNFKMGLLIDDPSIIRRLLVEVSKICDVRILDYDATEKHLDNTVFYLGFSNEIRRLLSLTQDQTNDIIVNSNRIMQMLDERGEEPFKTFDYIKRFAEFTVHHAGEAYNPIISQRRLTTDVIMTWIQPPCGSNSYILEYKGDELLFVDCGFAYYRDESLAVYSEIYPNFISRKKSLILTHSDIDHCGCTDLFDTVYVNRSCFENFRFENEGRDSFREQNPSHAPHYRISRIISGYKPPDMQLLRIVNSADPDSELPLSFIGSFSFGDMDFNLYEGNGGHVRGEMILVDDEHQIVFTGDNFVNIAGFSPEQAAFNKLSPYLMTSVNVDSAKATSIRKAIMQYKDYLLCPAHGDILINMSP